MKAFTHSISLGRAQKRTESLYQTNIQCHLTFHYILISYQVNISTISNHHDNDSLTDNHCRMRLVPQSKALQAKLIPNPSKDEN